jgi:hypothetical protein
MAGIRVAPPFAAFQIRDAPGATRVVLDRQRGSAWEDHLRAQWGGRPKRAKSYGSVLHAMSWLERRRTISVAHTGRDPPRSRVLHAMSSPALGPRFAACNTPGWVATCRPFRLATRQNRRISVRVHVSYRTNPHTWAFHPRECGSDRPAGKGTACGIPDRSYARPGRATASRRRTIPGDGDCCGSCTTMRPGPIRAGHCRGEKAERREHWNSGLAAL